MKSRQWIILGSALGVLIAAFGLQSFFASQKEPPEAEKKLTVKKYVSTVSVQYEDVATHVVGFGRVQTAQSLDLLSEVSGRMYQGKVRLKEGERFGKGTLLFYIDDTEARFNLKSQKSNFLRDIASILPDIKIDFTPSYPAWEKYFSSLEIDKDLPELPDVKSEKEKTFLATKGIYSTFYSIKSVEARLKKHWYYAPFNGSISSISMESGAFVNPGAKIGTILRSGLHELKVSIETRDIPWIQLGAPVDLFSEETQQSWKGEVVRISDFVNQNTQSVDVFIRIQTNDQKIYDGQFIQAAVPARIIKDGMEIPRNVLYNGNEVFIVEDTLLKVKEVNVHRLMGEKAIISGLDTGADLVVEPLVNAHNNLVVYKQERKDIDLETGLGLSASSDVDNGNGATN